MLQHSREEKAIQAGVVEVLLAALFSGTGAGITLLWAWLAIRDWAAKPRIRRALPRV
jgi:hypothetical protein